MDKSAVSVKKFTDHENLSLAGRMDLMTSVFFLLSSVSSRFYPPFMSLLLVKAVFTTHSFSVGSSIKWVQNTELHYINFHKYMTQWQVMNNLFFIHQSCDFLFQSRVMLSYFFFSLRPYFNTIKHYFSLDMRNTN